jgi:phosphoglycerol transferase MdoB-like AlkP superfamily enzyme
LESFGAVIAEPLDGKKGVAPNLTEFCEEGILFDHFYSNSFRTDRGLVSVLSGYPAQAAASIMKYPQKTQTLPAIPKTLGRNGYSRELFYGGDIDFTNMRSYFFGCCEMEQITSDVDFPLKDRMTKWGAPDHVVIDAFAERLQNPHLPQPFFKMALTLSSHEPFEVPFHKFDDPFLNSIAYTDSCLGDFVEKFKKTPYWNNTLIILVPDHGPGYPRNIEIFNPKRYRIPMIWLGGAVKQPAVIHPVGSQMDLAATLLSQLNMKHDDFIFSKNMLNPASPHFAFYNFVNGFGWVDSTGNVVYDHDAGKVTVCNSPDADSLIVKGKAYSQYLYRDLDKR